MFLLLFSLFGSSYVGPTWTLILDISTKKKRTIKQKYKTCICLWTADNIIATALIKLPIRENTVVVSTHWYWLYTQGCTLSAIHGGTRLVTGGGVENPPSDVTSGKQHNCYERDLLVADAVFVMLKRAKLTLYKVNNRNTGAFWFSKWYSLSRAQRFSRVNGGEICMNNIFKHDKSTIWEFFSITYCHCNHNRIVLITQGRNGKSRAEKLRPHGHGFSSSMTSVHSPFRSVVPWWWQQVNNFNKRDVHFYTTLIDYTGDHLWLLPELAFLHPGILHRYSIASWSASFFSIPRANRLKSKHVALQSRAC